MGWRCLNDMSQKKIAIMQPTYFPWLGYFALMDRVDEFVFLDSVQFERRSWQQRNRIKTANGVQLLTVPVMKKGLRQQKINEVEIQQDVNYIAKHIGSISAAYSKAPFYDRYREDLFSVLAENYTKLSDLTIGLTVKLKNMLGIECCLCKSSDMDVSGTKADLLANICEQLSATQYISPVGSRGYLEASTAFQEKNIAVEYNEYIHPEYPQLFGTFEPFMSIIDLLFNTGPDSLAIIRSGV